MEGGDCISKPRRVRHITGQVEVCVHWIEHLLAANWEARTYANTIQMLCLPPRRRSPGPCLDDMGTRARGSCVTCDLRCLEWKRIRVPDKMPAEVVSLKISPVQLDQQNGSL